jgi:hypothetical protein
MQSTQQSLSQLASDIAERLRRRGLKARISQREFDELMRQVTFLSHMSPGDQHVMIKAWLIQCAMIAKERKPEWSLMAELGVSPRYSPVFEPRSPDTKRLYARLLMNNALARSVAGGELKSKVWDVLFHAYRFMEGEEPSRHMATVYALLVPHLPDEQRVKQANAALEHVIPHCKDVDATEERLKIAAGIPVPGFIGDRIEPLPFTRRDLYVFDDG